MDLLTLTDFAWHDRLSGLEFPIDQLLTVLQPPLYNLVLEKSTSPVIEPALH